MGGYGVYMRYVVGMCVWVGVSAPGCVWVQDMWVDVRGRGQREEGQPGCVGFSRGGNESILYVCLCCAFCTLYAYMCMSVSV